MKSERTPGVERLRIPGVRSSPGTWRKPFAVAVMVMAALLISASLRTSSGVGILAALTILILGNIIWARRESAIARASSERIGVPVGQPVASTKGLDSVHRARIFRRMFLEVGIVFLSLITTALLLGASDLARHAILFLSLVAVVPLGYSFYWSLSVVAAAGQNAPRDSSVKSTLSPGYLEPGLILLGTALLLGGLISLDLIPYDELDVVAYYRAVLGAFYVQAAINACYWGTVILVLGRIWRKGSAVIGLRDPTFAKGYGLLLLVLSFALASIRILLPP